MVAEAIKKTSDFNLQGKTCPDCGEELIDDACRICNPEEAGEEAEEEIGADLDEEELE